MGFIISAMNGVHTCVREQAVTAASTFGSPEQITAGTERWNEAAELTAAGITEHFQSAL